MTSRQKELRDWEWNTTFDDFCEQLKQGTLSHESWFRNQQKKSQAGGLSEDKNRKLCAVLHKDWEFDDITGLRNNIKAGNIGIMKEPDNGPSFQDAVESLNTDADALGQ